MTAPASPRAGRRRTESDLQKPAGSLRDIDLNLLVVLEALLRTCNVTRAARELSLSQSAVSHALQRLRRLLGDPLLVRSRNEMVPTARGRSLLAPTQQLLLGIDRLISPSTRFPSGRMRQIFRLLSTDYPQIVMLQPLAKRMAAHAPEATLELHYLTTLLPDRELDSGSVDLCIAHMPFDLPSRLRRRTLFHDRYVIICRPGHPGMSRGLTLERYARLGHIGFFSRGAELFNTLVEKPEVHRDKRITVANLGLVPELVASSNYVATISARCALLFRERYPLEIHECPFGMKHFPVELIWHQRDDDDDAHAWLRDTLIEIGTEIEARPLGPDREAGAAARRRRAAPQPAEPRSVG
jgi:DNA-binding transcriptional LysR family regulator